MENHITDGVGMKVIKCKGRKPLYCLFQGQLKPQPAFIEIDWEARTIRADYSSLPDHSVPEAVYNRRIFRFPVSPNLGTMEVNRLMKSLVIPARQAALYYTVKWVDGSAIGTFTVDVSYWTRQIELICNKHCEA